MGASDGAEAYIRYACQKSPFKEEPFDTQKRPADTCACVRYNSWVAAVVSPTRLLRFCYWDCGASSAAKTGLGNGKGQERRGGEADCGAEDVAKRLYDKVVGIGVRRNLTFSRRFHDLITDAHGDPWRLLSPVCVCVCVCVRVCAWVGG